MSKYLGLSYGQVGLPSLAMQSMRGGKVKAEPDVTRDIGWPCKECNVGHLTLAAIILPTLPTVAFVNTT